MHKVTILWKFELKNCCLSKLRDNYERKNTLVARSCVLSDAWFWDLNIVLMNKWRCISFKTIEGTKIHKIIKSLDLYSLISLCIQYSTQHILPLEDVRLKSVEDDGSKHFKLYFLIFSIFFPDLSILSFLSQIFLGRGKFTSTKDYLIDWLIALKTHLFPFFVAGWLRLCFVLFFLLSSVPSILRQFGAL